MTMKDPQDPACGHSLTEGGGEEATGPSSEIPTTLPHIPLPAVCNSAQAAHGLLISGKQKVLRCKKEDSSCAAKGKVSIHT